MGLPAVQRSADPFSDGAASAERGLVPFDRFAAANRAAEVLRAEADALLALAKSPPAGLLDAADLIESRGGGVVVTGMGKAGLVGRKIAATLASLGTPACVLHPGEAVHGDLGMVRDDATVLALSHSGETAEVTQILAPLARREVPVVAVTARAGSTLGRAATVVVAMGQLREADVHNLAPTVSTCAMMALGDALAVLLSERAEFTPDRFAAFHPAGSLGRKLARVDEVMRTGSAVRVFADYEPVRKVLVTAEGERRTGAVMLIDDAGRLTGLFTDSDLARLLARRGEHELDRPVSAVMTRSPITVGEHVSVGEAVSLLKGRKLSELPVVDASGRPVGLVDITDLIGLV
ncbi:KpsF/GutQ family sugar-phosphate isomerase [Alienimonas californiensis]|uniref:Arabinose 5-phosphate isomerase KdsD n=1 Tax=Alienimonas californiensis TaxID=2527989 RepID=A0A517P592_9PLAN|nr:KpsF/GutQ family sugar-phosphate isomerase [Alienimonas californiensis]QDT14516.1 Arabinose 5-phosphate isomerase KdsD [Alienimonas californiensis]